VTAKADMTITAEDRDALDTLEVRLKAILPEAYQESYEDVQPVSMGSAGLKYGFDGKVAWDQIWGSFCDLAMAGGPPHKGTLLEPAPRAAIDAQPDRYREVVEAICRGVTMGARHDTR
jgi:sirohydrochlorin cobaltochelatase